MYSPDEGHLKDLQKKPLLAFDSKNDFAAQREKIREVFLNCLGKMPEAVPLNPLIEYKHEKELYFEYRIRFDVEREVQAVCLLCIPKEKKEKYPLVVCLQGHSTGMEVSVNRPRNPTPDGPGDRDIALQAVERGYAAICLDQRGMGDRRTVISVSREELKNDKGNPRCYITAMNALLLGKTLIGERCWDISRVIDLALTYPEIDGDKIICTGNSGGGTATFYAACFDERIKVAMPACAVCTYKHSIGAMHHCSCNYIPGIAEFVDMGDLALLIAPRKLIVINGSEDPIFPAEGVTESFERIKEIYTAAGVPENCALATGEGGHRYYKAKAWSAFDTLTCGGSNY